MSEEKSFKPSQRKLDRARKEGRVLKSQLVTQVAVLFGGFCLIWAFGAQIWVAPKMLLEYGLSNPDIALGEVLEASQWMVIQMVAVGIGCCALAGVLAEVAQVGFSIEPSALAPKMERLDPAAGVKRLAGGIVKVWEPLLRILLVLVVGWLLIKSGLSTIAAADWMQVATVLERGQSMLLPLAKWLLGTVVLGAAFDFFLRRREFLRELSMDHQEMREEHKELEGEPMMKAMRRAMHESLAMQDVERRVRSSKVIVVRKAAAS